MSDKPLSDGDALPEDEANERFKRLVGNLVTTPHKPHKPKAAPGEPGSRPVSDRK
jgi:hypothetical protein